jgi:hypothetical protein
MIGVQVIVYASLVGASQDWGSCLQHITALGCHYNSPNMFCSNLTAMYACLAMPVTASMDVEPVACPLRDVSSRDSAAVAVTSHHTIVTLYYVLITRPGGTDVLLGNRKPSHGRGYQLLHSH